MPLKPAAVDLDNDLASARIERILNELFNDRNGALDHFAGRDLPNGALVQQPDHAREFRGRARASAAPFANPLEFGSPPRRFVEGES